jgi:hypothetical protein
MSDLMFSALALSYEGVRTGRRTDPTPSAS